MITNCPPIYRQRIHLLNCEKIEILRHTIEDLKYRARFDIYTRIYDCLYFQMKVYTRNSDLNVFEQFKILKTILLPVDSRFFPIGKEYLSCQILFIELVIEQLKNE